MRILNNYITKSFLVVFIMSIFVLTFGMLGGRIAQFLKVIINGLPFSTFLEAVYYMLPTILTYTIPWAVLAGVMLVFGRLSADSELTVMRASGISILQIVSPIIVMVILITAFCAYMHLELGPIGLGKQRALTDKAAVHSPAAMLEPGETFAIPDSDMTIKIGNKNKNNELDDIQIYIYDGDRIMQDISADKGKVIVDKDTKVLTIVLNDALIINRADKNASRVLAGETRFSLDLNKRMNEKGIYRRAKFMSFNELVARIKLEKKNNLSTCESEIELNKRIVFALSPIAFLLIGIPLAIRTNRRETSLGLFFSVLLAGAFFLMIVGIQSLKSFPGCYPQYLLWIPSIVYQVVGIVMLYRFSKK